MYETRVYFSVLIVNYFAVATLANFGVRHWSGHANLSSEHSKSH